MKKDVNERRAIGKKKGVFWEGLQCDSVSGGEEGGVGGYHHSIDFAGMVKSGAVRSQNREMCKGAKKRRKRRGGLYLS